MCRGVSACRAATAVCGCWYTAKTRHQVYTRPHAVHKQLLHLRTVTLLLAAGHVLLWSDALLMQQALRLLKGWLLLLLIVLLWRAIACSLLVLSQLLWLL